MKENVVLQLFRSKTKTTINNIYYFIYNKIVWEPYIVKLLNIHGKKVMIGSDNMDVNGFDAIIENENGNLFGADIKIVVTSNYFGKDTANWQGKYLSCIAVNDKFYSEIQTIRAQNTFVLFWDKLSGCICYFRKSDLSNYKSYYAKRGTVMMHEFLLSDINYTRIIQLTDNENRTLSTMKYTIDNVKKNKKIPLPAHFTNDQTEELIRKVITDLELNKYYDIYINFK